MKDRRKNNFERLNHILKAAEEIDQYVTDINEAAFLNDSRLSSAVLFQFSVIGEAVIHIENELLEKYEYPWYKVRAFRNLISHEYFNIKLTAVWRIIIDDLPELKNTIIKMIKNEF